MEGAFILTYGLYWNTSCYPIQFEILIWFSYFLIKCTLQIILNTYLLLWKNFFKTYQNFNIMVTFMNIMLFHREQTNYFIPKYLKVQVPNYESIISLDQCPSWSISTLRHQIFTIFHLQWRQQWSICILFYLELLYHVPVYTKLPWNWRIACLLWKIIELTRAIPNNMIFVLIVCMTWKYDLANNFCRNSSHQPV